VLKITKEHCGVEVVMKLKKYLLAATGPVLATGGMMLAPSDASAADVALKALPPPPPPQAAPSWAGLYVGVNAGGDFQFAQTHSSIPSSISVGNGGSATVTAPVSNSLTKAGFVGGGQIGYNWQSGTLVYGVEADISGLTGKTGLSQTFGSGISAQTSNQVDWMATFRGRFGFVAGGDTLLYATGGLALARVSNNFGYTSNFGTFNAQDHSTRTGFVAGLGAEHMLNQNWLVRIEGLYANLGSKTLFCSGCGGSKTTTFANQVAIVRLGLSYKFPPH
jgi:outer membrane immunogenic protein